MKPPEIFDIESRRLVHELIKKSLENETRLQTLRDFQTDLLLEDLQKRARKYGHLFSVDEDGSIRRDKNGTPVPIKIPSSYKVPHDLIEKLSERVQKLTGVLEVERQKSLPLDLSQFDYLLKPSEES
jgi:hypothetical protein